MRPRLVSRYAAEGVAGLQDRSSRPLRCPTKTPARVERQVVAARRKHRRGRWLLTHRHTDLQDEFRARIANTNAEPPVLVALRHENAEADKRVKELTADVTALTATIHQLGRIIHVLALENQQLRSGGLDPRKVVLLRTGDAP